MSYEKHHHETIAANRTRICIAANFTVEPIEDVLAYWMTQLGLSVDICFAPYNQVFQQLFEGGILRSNRAGINLVALDLDGWLVGETRVVARSRLEQITLELTAALRVSGESGSGGAILLFPSKVTQDGERAIALDAAKATIVAACSSFLGWTAIDLTPAVSLYLVREARDPFTDRLGNIPFTEEMYAAAATVVARWIRARYSKPRKVIAVDCDNTLWQGICGEGTVRFTPPHLRLQEFLLRQLESGVLLSLVSKNNESDVMAVLESDECLVRAEHITAWRINWLSKSENLKALSEELGLALDSFVFLDDSSYECAEVRGRVPEVLSIQLPAEPEKIPGFIEHLWVFDQKGATEEDRTRVRLYQAERQRAELSRRALSREEFLAALKIEISIDQATPLDLARIAQLTERTTQFNLTGVRHTERSLSSLLASSRQECWTVRVKDIFGDYGLVGAMICEIAEENVRVSTFLLSCRALGRGIEDRMLEKVRSRAVECGAQAVLLTFNPSARNRPALEFLHRRCGAPLDGSKPFECSLTCSGSSAEWRPIAANDTVEPAFIPKVVPSIRDEQGLIECIATYANSASSVIAAARTTMKERPDTRTPLVAPRNAMEEELSRTWSECLRIQPIGVKDDFVDIGGQSLAATRLLAKAQTKYGVEMTLAEFFEEPTVESVALRIRDALKSRQSAPIVSVH